MDQNPFNLEGIDHLTFQAVITDNILKTVGNLVSCGPKFRKELVSCGLFEKIFEEALKLQEYPLETITQFAKEPYFSDHVFWKNDKFFFLLDRMMVPGTQYQMGNLYGLKMISTTTKQQRWCEKWLEFHEVLETLPEHYKNFPELKKYIGRIIENFGGSIVTTEVKCKKPPAAVFDGIAKRLPNKELKEKAQQTSKAFKTRTPLLIEPQSAVISAVTKSRKNCARPSCTNISSEDNKFKSCGRCGVAYCSEECQEIHWPRHKLVCLPKNKEK